jgi:uncharacterized delta-60 repeat protein
MMSKKWIYTFVIMALIISSPCYAEEWAKTYGGRGSDYPSGSESIVQTTIDGGYIVGGTTDSFGICYDVCSNIWLLKLDSEGDIAWAKMYGEPVNGDKLDSIQQIGFGYIVSGTTHISLYGVDYASDIWVLRLDFYGNILWEKTYSRSSAADNAPSIRQTSDGGYIMAGKSRSITSDYDIWVMRFNPDGFPMRDVSIAWEKVYGGDSRDEPVDIVQTSDDGYVIAGDTSSFGAGDSDIWILKLNPDGHPDGNGSIAWQKTYGGTGSDHVRSIQQTADGGYIMAGQTSSFGGNDAWVLKLNPDGSIAWQKKYGRNDQSEASSIKQTFDELGYPDGYIVAAKTLSYNPGEALVGWLLKLDLYGNVTWEKTSNGNDNDSFESVQLTADGGYIVTGQTESFGAGYSDIWVLKLNPDGEIPCCSAIIDESVAVVSTTSAVVGSSDIQPQTSSVTTGSLGTTPYDTWAEDQKSTLCSAGLKVSPVWMGDFGDVLVGSSSTITVWINNTGSADVHISGMVLSDATNYSLNVGGGPGPCGSTTPNLAPNNWCTVTVTFNPSSAGTKDANLVISSDAACPLTVDNMSLTGIGVLSLRTIGYSPTGVSFTATQGGSNPSNQTLSVWNAGGGTLNWSVTDSATWLSCNPTSGVDSGTVTAAVNIAGLTAGTYNATITIAATGATNSPVTIPVTLTINPAPPSLTLIAPNRGEVIPSGSQYTIQWCAPSQAVRFTLKYSIDNDSTWKLIVKNITGTSYNWTVPTPSNNRKECLIKVIGFNASGIQVGSDKSDSKFMIEVVKVLSPDGAESLGSGSVHTITWRTNATIRPVAQVKLFYSVNGGTSWTAIKTLTGNPGNYNWTVPNVLSSSCKVKAVLKDSGGVTVGNDISDGVFTIQP